MDFYEAINKRRAVREFEPETVEAEKLVKVLAAGLKAPSHKAAVSISIKCQLIKS